MNAPTIDIVVPWVDGSDPTWIAERSKYMANETSDASDARYRDWDLFRYWFRGAEKYAPWVRKIHLVTAGQRPQWLNISHEKLHLVDHREFIPEEFLPTFSSHTIELNLHRIQGLSEEFVYFNDDFFIIRETKETDFFRGGVPVETAVQGIVKNRDINNFMPHIMLNNLALINMTFSKRSVLRKAPYKWYTPRNGWHFLMNYALMPWGCFTGFRNYHSAEPLRKSTMEEVWAAYGEVLSATCKRKFRSREDVNQYLFRYWQLCKNDFSPAPARCAYVTIGIETRMQIEKEFQRRSNKILCINDDPMEFDFEEERAWLEALFSEKFPEPSSYEKSLKESFKNMLK